MRNALPNWPRLLNADLAAAYVGVSKTTFLGDVGKRWPLPISQGRRRVWDIRQLDEHVDQLAGVGEASDPLMEALK
jgi:hypothetical protein